MESLNVLNVDARKSLDLMFGKIKEINGFFNGGVVGLLIIKLMPILHTNVGKSMEVQLWKNGILLGRDMDGNVIQNAVINQIIYPISLLLFEKN